MTSEVLMICEEVTISQVLMICEALMTSEVLMICEEVTMIAWQCWHYTISYYF